MAEKLVVAYITAKDRDEAWRIGRALVEKRLAACINVWDGMRSCYRWEGKIEEASEAVLLAKTTESNADALVKVVKALHGYSVPCVVFLPVEGGNPEYLQWLRDAVSS